MSNTISFGERKKQSLVKTAVTALRGNGYTIIKEMPAQETAIKLLDELAPYFDEYPVGEGLFYGNNTKRVNAIFTKSKAAQLLATDETVLGIIEGMLGINCDRFQIHLTQAISILPGEGAQVPHKDSDSYPIPHLGHEFMINVMWPMTPFTSENGATYIYSGSHVRNYSDLDLMSLGKPDIAECEPGDAIIWTGSALHGGGANMSKIPRSGLVISYSLGWLRQAENQFLTYCAEDLEGFSPELIDLLGFVVHRPNLGWVNGDEPRKSLGYNLAPQPTRDIFDQDMTQRLEAFVEIQKQA